MKHTSPEKLLIGAHTSASGGAHNALLEGKAIGATTIQFFTSNQRQWKGKSISDSELGLWKDALEESGIQQIMSHDSYLINLGSPNQEMLHKSVAAFKQEILRCHQLELTFLNFHPGAALESSEEACLERIVESLLSLESVIAEGKTRLLLEATAGQGSAVGYRFEHLAYLMDKLHRKIPVGICIDTCHIFVAGYDISTKQGWDHVLKQFDALIGLKHLYALHLNDSLKPLGARVDRHAPLGDGTIGIECFQTVMRHPALRDLPKYLETPGGPPLWKKEIQMLRDFAHA